MNGLRLGFVCGLMLGVGVAAVVIFRLAAFALVGRFSRSAFCAPSICCTSALTATQQPLQYGTTGGQGWPPSGAG